VFQEQVLRITSDFAGMTLAKSDQFRRFMSKCRDPTQMEALRSTFVVACTSPAVISIGL